MRNKIPNPNPDTRQASVEPPLRLSPEEVASLRNQQAIISIQRHILSSLENEFARIVAEGLGVDIKKEAWELDLDKGEIRRANDAQQ